MNRLLYAKKFGQAHLPPIVILHGLFGSGENWLSIAKKLCTTYQVWLVDLRNHGQSFHDPSMDYRVMCEDIAYFLHHHKLHHIHLLGHSMGGKVAMITALTYPQYIDRLMVVDISPIPYKQREHIVLIEAMRSIDLSLFDRRSGVDKALGQSIPDPKVRQFLLKNLMIQEGRIRWRIHLEALQEHIDDILEFPTITNSYLSPTLFLKGEYSDYINNDHHPLIYKLFPKAHIITLKGGGHWLQADVPDAFVKTILSFLNR